MVLQLHSALLRSCYQKSVSKFSWKRKYHRMNLKKGTENPKILITGGLGQLGVDCAKVLRQVYGVENVILSDIVKPTISVKESGPFVYADVLDVHSIKKILVKHEIDWIVHFAALLSFIGEENVFQAIKVNIEGLHNVMNLALQNKLRIFVPSSIGAFGPETPRYLTPNNTTQRPKTIYGVAKVHAELLGEYYYHKYRLDFRCLRFPGVISCGLPGGGTTDYAVAIFNEAISKGYYECYLKPDTVLPMIYIDDCLRAVKEFISIPDKLLRKRTYNIAAMSFSPEDITNEIKRYIPHFCVRYKPDSRQGIADTWPQVLDDSEARHDWFWHPHYDLPKLTETMMNKYSEAIQQETAAQLALD